MPNSPGWVMPVNATPGMCRDVALLAGEVPDRLVGVRELVGEEPAAVGLGEDAGVAPALAGRVADLLRQHGPEVEDVDDEQVTRLGALDAIGPREHVRAGEVHVADVVRGVVVADLAVGPLAALDPDLLPGPDRRRRAGCRGASGCGRARPGRASTWPGRR